MSCTEEEALEISKDFLNFAKEVEQKNEEKWKEQAKEKLQKDPLENLCKLLEKLVILGDENRFLKNRVDFLERQDELQRIIIRSTFVGQRREKKILANTGSLDQAGVRSDRRRRSSSGGGTWTKMKDAIRKTSERESPVIKVDNRRGDSESSVASSYDNILGAPDPYAELEGHESHLSTDLISVKRSSSTGQVTDHLKSKFVQRRHSLTSISDDCSPEEDIIKKHQKTPWKMVRSIMGHSKSDNQPVKKKAVTQQAVKKPSLMEIAREEDPYLGIWMGPQEKLDPEMPLSGPKNNPRSKSFEVPTAKSKSLQELQDLPSSFQERSRGLVIVHEFYKQLDMISQGKVSRGVSYSPKVSTAAPSMPKNITEGGASSSKWSRVRNAFLNKDESLTLEESMSMPSSPTQKTSSFFADTADLEQPKVKVDEKESSGSRSSGDWHNIHGEIQSNYHQLQRQLSQEFQMKMMSWEKDRQTNKETPSSPILPRNPTVAQSSAQDLMAKSNFPPDFKKKYEQWQKIKDEPNPTIRNNLPQQASNSATSPTIEKKINARPLKQQNIQEQDLKPEFRLKVAEWEVRKALAGASGKKNVDEIRQLMPDDFNKKLSEWEQKKQAPPAGSTSPVTKAKMSSSNAYNSQQRHNSRQPDGIAVRQKSSHESGIAWLEKELYKLQREKRKLEREKAKYIDREQRLEKIRIAMRNQQQKEITVKTSTGEEFKFGGISEKFTRKLFEWEERKNIAPESSTIALLNSNLYGDSPTSKNELDGAHALKRSRSEGSILDPSDQATSNKSMGGSEGNISQCSTRKSTELVIAESSSDLDEGPPPVVPMTEEEKQLHRQQCLSRHDSIRTQANIQLLDEKISLIGSLKAHREHCQHLETTLRTLEDQASKLPQVPLDMITTIQELKKDVLSTFHYPGPSKLSHSESDLSCCEVNEDLCSGAEALNSTSNLSSSHSMSRYGSESPLRSLLIPEYTTDYDVLKSQECEDNIIEEMDGDGGKLDTIHSLSHQTSSNSESRGRSSSRCNNRLRRPSSDEISTPTSLRSRSSSLLSSDYIAEENEESNVGVVADNACLPLLPPPTFKGSANNSSSRRTSSSSHSSVGSKNSHEMANDIDRLVKLVHELKEEDLKSYKRKIAERESSKNRHRGSSEESTSESLPPPTLDLQKVLVPTTTRIINAIPHLEPSEMPSKTCPIVLELANASLDLMLTPDSKIYSKASSASDLSNPENPMGSCSILNDTEKGNLLTARANQLKKARDDFFFGNQENEAANTSRPQSLAVNTEGMAGNILDSPSSDMDVSSSSNVQRQIIKFGGSTGGGGGGSGSRRSSRAFSGRHSFTEPEQEDIEATGFPAPPAVEVAEEDKREKREKLISPPLSPKSRERKTGAIPKVLNKK